MTIVFRELLHPSSKFTVVQGKSSYEQNFDTFAQVLNGLDGSITLHQNTLHHIIRHDKITYKKQILQRYLYI